MRGQSGNGNRNSFRICNEGRRGSLAGKLTELLSWNPALVSGEHLHGCVRIARNPNLTLSRMQTWNACRPPPPRPPAPPHLPGDPRGQSLSPSPPLPLPPRSESFLSRRNSGQNRSSPWKFVWRRHLSGCDPWDHQQTRQGSSPGIGNRRLLLLLHLPVRRSFF